MLIIKFIRTSVGADVTAPGGSHAIQMKQFKSIIAPRNLLESYARISSSIERLTKRSQL